jgi:beta-glucosidase
LRDAHKDLIRGCKDLGKKVVTILISGRVLAIGPELEISDAFIAAWLPGSEGDGIADFLFAIDGFKPKGKSPYSWPADVADLPLAPYAEHALFKFGFGLQEY